ncbi:hypothetical protein MMC06_006174, partial [Schaereria dolodes]|nr:hypothetical protein [Schaereria dolodes]
MDNETSPQPVFQNPSLSSEVEAEKGDSHKLLDPNTTVSLATNPYGTTFAARARAAELNAVRSRKAVPLLQYGEDVPTSTPMSLGSVMRFTKPRARPKAWKALYLRKPEETETGSLPRNMDYTQYDQSDNARTESIEDNSSTELSKSHNNVNTNGALNFSTFFSTVQPTSSQQSQNLSPHSQKLELIVANYDPSEWDPEMPAGSANNSRPLSRASSSQVGSHQGPQRSPAAVAPELSGISPSSTVDAVALQKLRQMQEAKIAELESTSLLNSANIDESSQHLDLPQEAKLAELGVVSTAYKTQRQRIDSGIMLDVDESPFDDSSPTVHQNTWSNEYGSSYGSQNEYRSTRPLRYQYPAVKGTTNNEFRFPSQYPKSGDLHNNQFHTSQYLQENLEPFSKRFVDSLSPLTNQNSNQSTSMSYIRLSTEDKKDMLRKNLDNLVDLNDTRGNTSTSTRTVLYDPIAHSGARAQPVAANTPMIPAKARTELLVTSEPLPWKDRPVDIHDVSTPGLSNAELAVLSSLPHLQIMPPQLRLPKQESPHGRASVPAAQMYNEIESWWRSQPSGEPKTISFLLQTGASHRERRRIEDSEARMQAAQRRTNISDNWSDSSASTTIPEDLKAAGISSGLMIPILANLHGYLQPAGYFGRFGRAADWCVDQGHGGQASFFGEDWGAPPPRVGRDP